MDIIERIQRQYESLSRTQKRIADYLFTHADEACFLPLKSFAEHVNATEVTVVNFTHRIGLDSFVELKKELQNYLRMRVSPYGKLKRAIQMPHGLTVDANDLIENELELLRHTYGKIDSATISRTVEMLEGASKVYVVGYDSSLPVAQFLLLRLRYLGFDAQQLDFGDYSHMTLELSRSDEQALFILISFPVHYGQMKALAALLYKTHHKFISIVNDPSAPIAADADLTLSCDTTDVIFYNSITSAISLVNLISNMYASRHQASLLSIRTAVQQTVQAMNQLMGENEASNDGM